ncbi:hypothetical protein KY290_000850 [Solanum tuberosum]|uniref:Uncharacterized protein n=1 Tax=Solanum tuberosum TaxID=4113 RepID=A0ABQ7WKG7_SOLTU|nr:hypothetical protein KY289_000908 [Solanum tuberosum]KAH0781252.1 hypothetical protein KY290_000850 [Solanum tuberosum]
MLCDLTYLVGITPDGMHKLNFDDLGESCFSSSPFSCALSPKALTLFLKSNASRLGEGRVRALVQDAWEESFGQDVSRPRDSAGVLEERRIKAGVGRRGGDASRPEAGREGRVFGQDASRSGDEGASGHDSSRSGWGVCMGGGGRGVGRLKDEGGLRERRLEAGGGA